MISSTVRGGAGNDTISLDLGAGSNQAIYADKGNDLFAGSVQKATLYGGVGNDNAAIDLTSSYLYAGAGNDSLSIDTATTNNSTIYGGDGADTLQVVAAVGSGLFSDLGAGNDSLAFAGAVSTTTILGGAGDEIMNFATTVRAASIIGGDGNDSLNFGATGTNQDNTYYFGFGHGNDSLNFNTIQDAGSATGLTVAVSSDYGNTGTIAFTASTSSAMLTLGGNGSIYFGNVDAANFGTVATEINIITVAASTITFG